MPDLESAAVSRPRRVVVNTAIHLHGTSGTSTATRALTDALQSLPGVEVLEAAPGQRGRRGPLRNALTDASWDLWHASRLHRDVGLLVSPCNVGLRGAARRHVLVVHDLMALDSPRLFDPKFAAYFRTLVPLSIRRAERVLTPSEHSRARIRARFPGADVRVVAWPHGSPVEARASWSEAPVVLMVGATEPVKNQVEGIHAVMSLRRDTGADVRLRVIGPAGRAEIQVRSALDEVDPAGAWSSREVDVPPSTLAKAYVDAWLLLQPSLDEGFGIPLLEAAAYGLPTVHSGRGAMSEVVPHGSAGSTQAPDLARVMASLLGQDAWDAAATDELAQARRFDRTTFVAALGAAVEDLLEVPR